VSKLLGCSAACAAMLVAGGPATGQPPGPETQALKAELAKTRADLDAVKKELAKTRADLDVLQAQVWAVMGPPRKEPRAEVQAELLKRWNAVADAPGGGAFNFKWADYGNFPHPTFRGGSGEAYGAFAKVLVAVLKTGDNFEFMAKNELFTAELRTSVPGGSLKGTGWTFAGFARQFAAPKSFATLDDETHKAIRELSARIDAATKK
jgi:hypothetical protein